MFCRFQVVEVIMSIVYKMKWSFTLFFKDNKLILIKCWTQKRNLNELIHIAFDHFGGNLKLAFNSKSEISAKRTEYSVDDIQKLLEILIEKSGNTFMLLIFTN